MESSQCRREVVHARRHPGATMRFRDFLYLLYADQYRYQGRSGWLVCARYLLTEPGFIYVFWLRVKSYLRESRPRLVMWPLHTVSALILRHCAVKYGICIPSDTRIGAGLYVGHFGGIVVNAGSVIGENCNLSHGVTLGQANRGERKGYPTIGNNVYIGPGAKLVGSVCIGDNVAIGANCVVTKDAPSGAVIVGVPGRPISYEGSAGYVEHSDYDSRAVWLEKHGWKP